MREIIWKASGLSLLWEFLVDNDEHYIVSKRGWEVLQEIDKQTN